MTMTTQSSPPLDIQAALDAFLKTTTMEEAQLVLHQYPNLLSDKADLLLSSIIISARKQGHETTAQALDERRNFIRSVRGELSESDN